MLIIHSILVMERYNTEECGWGGGDCNWFNVLYPECRVDNPYGTDDGRCDRAYNTEECGWDGGNCVVPGYPNCCHVDLLDRISDGKCSHVPYIAEECGWDGGDCLNDGLPNCHVVCLNCIGDGVCNGAYKMEERLPVRIDYLG